MKGKIPKILSVGLALALVLSLSLVATPVPAASPADTDVGYTLAEPGGSSAATWDDTEKKFGSYSVKLVSDTGDSGDLHVEFIPAAGTTLSDLEALTNDWGFWYYFTAAALANGPQLELKFTSGTDFVDITVMAAQHEHAVHDAWEEVVLADDLISVGYFGSVVGFEAGAGQTLAQAIDAVLTADPDCGDWELTLVQAEIYMAEATARTCYIDDITIDGVTYELEPIFLDAEYYSVGDTVTVTVPNFAANTDPIRVNPVTADPADTKKDWEVTVTSDSDPAGITVDLEETGINTGVFTGSFATTSTTPAGEDELYVQDGDTITVGYTSDEKNWGAKDSATTSIEAKVDDTAPTITVVSPKDGEQIIETIPTIEASYADDPNVSGIDTDSVEMFFNGVDVTDDAVADGDNVTYTPEEELIDGSYEVTVNVSDNAGNEATETWSFRVVSWLEGPESVTDQDSLDALDTVGVAVSGATGIAGGEGDIIQVGRYASNPEPEAPPTFAMIEDGFFDVKVTGAEDATLIVIKFADDNITAESTAYVWDDLEGAWLECSDQGYNSVDEFLWVKVRDDTSHQRGASTR